MFRFTFHFTNYTQGWSETLFRTNNFTGNDTVFLTNYINRRLELLATTCTLVSVRASNVDTKRDITIYPLPNAGRGGAWTLGGAGTEGTPGLPTETEDSFTALLLRLSDGNNNYRSFPLLGLPDHIIQGGVVVPGEQAIVNGRLNNWIAAMTQASLGGKFQGVPSATGRISSFPAKTEENQQVCLGLKGAIPQVNSIVILGGVKPWNKLNRQWRVAGTAAGDAENDGYIYLANSDSINTFGPVNGGTYKQATYSVSVLNQYSISRVTPRKTGIPFVTVRGRR